MKYVVSRVYMCLAPGDVEDMIARARRFNAGRVSSWDTNEVRFITHYCVERPCRI